MIQYDVDAFLQYAKIIDTEAVRIEEVTLPTAYRSLILEVLNALRDAAPYRDKPSGRESYKHLRDSFESESYRYGNSVITVFFSNLDDQKEQPWWQPRTAYWQLYGTYGRGGYIYPVRAKALRIPTPEGWIYRSRVKGQNPNRFTFWALQSAVPKIEAELPRLGAMILQGLNYYR